MLREMRTNFHFYSIFQIYVKPHDQNAQMSIKLVKNIWRESTWIGPSLFLIVCCHDALVLARLTNYSETQVSITNYDLKIFAFQ